MTNSFETQISKKRTQISKKNAWYHRCQESSRHVPQI